MLLETVVLLVIISAALEGVDSALGMMYGTLLAPILLMFGYEPIIVVPAILASQGLGGIVASLMHHKKGNASFGGMTRDTKVALAMIIPGLFAVCLGVLAAMNLPPIVVKTYIGVLVIVMGMLCLGRLRFTFAWWKHCVIGAVAAFNKSISGGGFGPVTSTGGIIGGLKAKVSVATTTIGEVFICSAALLAYIIIGKVELELMIPLCIGAVVGGAIGPIVCSRAEHGTLRKAIGILGVASGLILLGKVWL